MIEHLKRQILKILFQKEKKSTYEDPDGNETNTTIKRENQKHVSTVLTTDNIHGSENNDFLNTHKLTPLLKPNILNLQLKIQMKFNDANHYSVKTLS